MNTTGYVVVYTIAAVIVLAICGVIADALGQSRGFTRSQFWWGFLLGAIGIIVVAIMPTYRVGDNNWEEDYYQLKVKELKAKEKEELDKKLNQTKKTSQDLINWIKDYMKSGEFVGLTNEDYYSKFFEDDLESLLIEIPDEYKDKEANK